MKKKLPLLLLIAFFLISCEALFVENISDKSVQILAPSSDTILSEGTINFSWNEVVDAEEYTFQIATPTFDNATQIITDTILISSSFDKELQVGEYEWRVKAKNSQYQTEYSVANFTIN